MSRNLAVILFLSFFATLIIALANSYFMNLKGAEVDAERFLRHAREWSETGSWRIVTDAEFFFQYLGLLIYLFGFDEFFLTLVGFCVYYFTFIFLFSKIRYQSIHTMVAFHIVLYMCMFSPSVLLRIGALLREPYVILTIVMMVYFGVRYIETRRIHFLVVTICAAFVGMFFHKALLAFSPVFIVFLLAVSLTMRARSIVLLCIVGFLTILLAEVFLPELASTRGGQALSVILSGDFQVAEKIVGIKSGRDFRTTYNYGANFKGLDNVAITILKANVYYYLSPFPWKIQTAVDLLAFAENMIRFSIIVFVAISVVKTRNRPALFALGCYLLFNTIWAVGTSNYGTASRHHITSLPLLLLVIIVLSNNLAFWRKERLMFVGRAPLNIHRVETDADKL